MDFERKSRYELTDLLKIVKILRSPEGCPWDRVQTHSSIRSNFIEEVYEAVEALDLSDSDMLKEELGDVLLQIVFHCDMEEDSKNFSFDDVVDGICKKLILRHPHVFSDKTAKTPEQAQEMWAKVKMASKHQSPVDGVRSVSKILPSLMRTQKIQSKAAREGYGMFSIEGALNETYDRLNYIKTLVECGKQEDYSKEIGDLLFSVTELARLIGVDAETSLYDSCEKFTENFIKKILLENR